MAWRRWHAMGRGGADVAVLTSTPASEEQRVKLFFSETGASYILGHADVSALAAHVMAMED